MIDEEKKKKKEKKKRWEEIAAREMLRGGNFYVKLSSSLISCSVRSHVAVGGLTPVSPWTFPVSLSAWLISAEPRPVEAVG